jgi:hypothetical protein
LDVELKKSKPWKTFEKETSKTSDAAKITLASNKARRLFGVQSFDNNFFVTSWSKSLDAHGDTRSESVGGTVDREDVLGNIMQQK